MGILAGSEEPVSESRKWYSVRWRELLVILVILVLGAIVFLPTIEPAFEAKRRAACQNNLKTLGSILRLYAMENESESLPPMHGYEPFGKARNATGCLNVYDDFDFAPDMRALYPEYLQDPLTLVCPSGPYGKRPSLFLGRITIGENGYTDDAQGATGLVRDDGSGTCQYAEMLTNGDVSYTYLGWAIDEEDLWFKGGPVIGADAARRAGLPLSGRAQYVALACRILDARSKQGAASAALLDADILLKDVVGERITLDFSTGRWNDGCIRRFRGEFERCYITDWSQTVILRRDMAVAFDNVLDGIARSGHVPAGGNVLYMDGHVEFVRYPERFPMTEDFAGLLAALKEK